MSLAAFAVLVSVLAVAVWTDARRRRIPNGLTLGGLAAACIAAFTVDGFQGLVAAAAGALAGAALLLPLYLPRGLGAGDVKLMGVVGACLGPVGAVEAALFTLVAGALFALPRLVFRPDRGNAVRHVAGMSTAVGPVGAGCDLQPARKQKFPYASAIAVGAALAAWRGGIAAALGLPA